MKKSEKIKQVYDLLNLGCVIGFKNGYAQKEGNNICYVHAGASAIHCNLENLKWIINTIFRFKYRDFDYEILMF